MKLFSLFRVSGVCAVVYPPAGVAFSILMASTGVRGADNASETLDMMSESPVTFPIVAGLLVVFPHLIALSGLGFYHALRHVGSIMQIALVAFVGGSLAVVYRGAIWIALSESLSPEYADADESTKGTIVILAETLEKFAWVANMTGAVFILGIGVLLFSLALLHEPIAPKWVARLGILVSILGGWLILLTPFSGIIEIITDLGFFGFLVWMFAMGLALLRLPDDDIPAGPEGSPSGPARQRTG